MPRKATSKKPSRKKARPAVIAKCKEKGLTDKESKFVAEYLVDNDIKRAYVAAGYSYNPSNARALLQKPHIRQFMARALSRAVQRINLTADNVLRELARIGMADMRYAYDEEGNLKAPHEMDDETFAAISEIKITEQKNRFGEVTSIKREIKQWDKVKALHILAQHFKLISSVTEIHNKYEIGKGDVDIDSLPLELRKQLLEHLRAKEAKSVPLLSNHTITEEPSNAGSEPRSTVASAGLDDLQPQEEPGGGLDEGWGDTARTDDRVSDAAFTSGNERAREEKGF